jgi:hypothetical protein
VELLEAIAVNAWGWTVAAVVLVVVFVCGMGVGSVLAHSRLQAAEEHQAAVKEWHDTFPEESHELGPGRHRRPDTPPADPGPELAAEPVGIPPADGPAPAFDPEPLPGYGMFVGSAEPLPAPVDVHPAALTAWPPESGVIVADLTSPKFPMLYGPRLAELRALSPQQRLDVLIMASGYAADAIDRALRDLRSLR